MINIVTIMKFTPTIEFVKLPSCPFTELINYYKNNLHGKDNKNYLRREKRHPLKKVKYPGFEHIHQCGWHNQIRTKKGKPTFFFFQPLLLFSLINNNPYY